MNEKQLSEAITKLVISFPHVGVYLTLTDFDFRSDLNASLPAFTIKDKTTTVNVTATAKLHSLSGDVGKLCLGPAHLLQAQTSIEGSLVQAFQTAQANNELNDQFMSIAISVGKNENKNSLIQLIPQDVIDKYTSISAKQITNVDLATVDLSKASNELLFDTAATVAEHMKRNHEYDLCVKILKTLPIQYQVMTCKWIPTKTLAEFIERSDVKEIAENLMTIIFGV